MAKQQGFSRMSGRSMRHQQHFSVTDAQSHPAHSSSLICKKGILLDGDYTSITRTSAVVCTQLSPPTISGNGAAWLELNQSTIITAGALFSNTSGDDLWEALCHYPLQGGPHRPLLWKRKHTSVTHMKA